MTTDDRTTRLSTAADEQPTLDLGATAVLADEQPTPDLAATAVLADERPSSDGPADSEPPHASYGTPPTSNGTPSAVSLSYDTPSFPPPAQPPAPPRPLPLPRPTLGLTVIAPVVGLVFGILGLRREPTGRTLSIWGIVLNAVMLGIVLLMVIAVLVVVLVIPFAATGSSRDFR
ncbi:hypothetical protein C5D98_03950 [Rathayibacter rathayi]|uniref:DUF4190 domain-containing protein n=1 Tax=Rathayibacter rathayi TaxID=33887 RepID=UPI000CE84A9D|nr:DUF4190 domain-containing protein [Rathayibacter rathayi]PPI72859.1 hypothetical protein C5D98_03950 [Rathayibacter rathayi]